MTAISFTNTYLRNIEIILRIKLFRRHGLYRYDVKIEWSVIVTTNTFVYCRRSTTTVSAASCTSTSTPQTCLTICTDTSFYRSSNARLRRWLSAATCRRQATVRTATWSGRAHWGTRRQRQGYTSRRHVCMVLPRNYTDSRKNYTTSAAPLSCLVDVAEQVYIPLVHYPSLDRPILLLFLHLTPTANGFSWDGLRKILHGGQGWLRYKMA